MIFNSFNFLVVFPVIFLIYYCIPAKYNQIRNFFLLVISYLLYINWKPSYALILFSVTLITYWGGIIIDKIKRKRLVLYLIIIFSLLPLLCFKYFNFINETIYSIFSILGFNYSLKGLNWIIPIGISFYTFQSLSYIWDVYYGKYRPEKNFLIYALYLSFFPSIVSGPINRASFLIPQIKKIRKNFDYDKTVEGLKLLLWGMFMKVVIADRLGLYVDTVMGSYNNYSGMTCFVASVAYSIQIYGDFAGYSLMAIGVGKTLGFELTENFKRPYLATSITDFWHRWHISLSTWLKDYIYIPLGGSRCKKNRNYFNIFITFLVSGIWHGANWTFIIWGLIHGIFQIIEKVINLHKHSYSIYSKILRIVFTFLIVNFAWIFFRMPSISSAFEYIYRIMFSTDYQNLYLDGLSLTTYFCIFLLISKDLLDEYYPAFSLFNNSRLIVRWGSYIFLITMIMLTGVFGADQFIYANF